MKVGEESLSRLLRKSRQDIFCHSPPTTPPKKLNSLKLYEGIPRDISPLHLLFKCTKMEDPAFTTSSIDDNTQLILLHASSHDLEALKPFLRTPGNASVQDPETGFTPLHAVIAACGPAHAASRIRNTELAGGLDIKAGEEGGKQEEEEEEEVDIEKARDVVKELFLSGAIWNDLDGNNETPGCLAWRLGRRELYDLVVDAGVRAEMLLGLMGGYEVLPGSDSEEDEEGVDEVTAEGEEKQAVGENGGEVMDGREDRNGAADLEMEEKKDVNSEDYLKSTLHFQDDKLLDVDANGVMMAWETEIMRRSVDLLLPPLAPSPTSQRAGKRILNIGFGMGIIDGMFRDTKPLSHHIIEAHPAVLEKLAQPGAEFGKDWEDRAPGGGQYVIHKGRWQDVVPRLLEAGEIFDVIYFDTFGEDYAQLKLFFSEFVVGLLDSDGRFGFFNGLGADRRVCYDVYCRVVELDLCDAGFDIEWADIPVDVSGEGEGEWKGVRRRYWTLENYRLPVCTFMG